MKKIIGLVAAFGVVVVMFGTIYAAVQQAQRNDANFPQIQLAEDLAAGVSKGYEPNLLVYGRVDIGKSLAPFTIVYDKVGKVVVSNGYLDGKVPKPPFGVLRQAQGKEYHAVTWQPKDGVRIAAVSVASKDYYILSGRSLREVEKNENRTLQIALLGGVLSMLLLGAALGVRLVNREYI